MAVTRRDLMNIPVSDTALRWAIYTSLKKFPYTGTGTRRRPWNERLDNLFTGDLAKSALIEYFDTNNVAISQEYDRVRTDGFNSAKRIDFHFIGNQSRIEVNSSLIPPGWSRTPIINNFDIKVTAGDGSKIWYTPAHQGFDITTQLYWNQNTNGLSAHYTEKQVLELSAELESVDDDLLDEIMTAFGGAEYYDNKLTGYGWAHKNDIEQLRLNNLAAGRDTTWSHPGNTRTYWNCKIKDTNPFNTLHTSV